MNSPQQTVAKLTSLYPNRSGASRNLLRWLRFFDVGKPHFETQNSLSGNRNNFAFLIAFNDRDIG